MSTKSRFQLINRGRKGRPLWCIHDSEIGKDLSVSDRRKGVVEGFMRGLRQLDREIKAKAKEQVA